MVTATEERTTPRIGHAQRLLDAMGGSPEGWEYTGEILEGDPAKTKCACGHPIRWLFIWEHIASNRKLITGSVCVENLPGITESYIEAMRQDLETAIAAKKAAARKAKEAAAQEEVTRLREETLAKIDRVYGWAMRNHEAAQGSWLPGGTYAALQDRRYYKARVQSAGKLKTGRGQINRLKETREALDREGRQDEE